MNNNNNPNLNFKHQEAVEMQDEGLAEEAGDVTVVSEVIVEETL